MACDPWTNYSVIYRDQDYVVRFSILGLERAASGDPDRRNSFTDRVRRAMKSSATIDFDDLRIERIEGDEGRILEYSENCGCTCAGCGVGKHHEPR